MNILIRSMSSRAMRSEEHTSELQSLTNLVCRLLLEKKKKRKRRNARSSDPQRTHSRQFLSACAELCPARPTRGLAERQRSVRCSSFCFFFFNDTATTEIYTLSLHDALPIWSTIRVTAPVERPVTSASWPAVAGRSEEHTSELQSRSDLVCRLLLEKKKR